MVDVGVFPSLPGLGWSVMKTPTFQTRIQRAVSGRELRALDYPYPLWQFTLVFNFLRDNNDSRAAYQSGYNELRTLAGFLMQCHGAFGTFLFLDPTDWSVQGQTLPPATSAALSVTPNAGGSGYSVGDLLTLSGGSGSPATATVTGVSGGAVTGLSIGFPGAYQQVPGSTGVGLLGGSGSGATANLTWQTTSQLVRTFNNFAEAMTAPNAVGNIYFNGTPQTGWSVDPGTGVVALASPFAGNTWTVVDLYIVTGGSGYVSGDLVTIPGTTFGPPFTMIARTDPTGAVNLLTAADGSALPGSQTGAYQSLPSNPATLAGGSGSGAQVFVTWGIQSQPIITADFSYYFRCRFINDNYPFENFMLNLWTLKTLSFITVRP